MARNMGWSRPVAHGRRDDPPASAWPAAPCTGAASAGRGAQREADDEEDDEDTHDEDECSDVPRMCRLHVLLPPWPVGRASADPMSVWTPRVVPVFRPCRYRQWRAQPCPAGMLPTNRMMTSPMRTAARRPAPMKSLGRGSIVSSYRARTPSVRMWQDPVAPKRRGPAAVEPLTSSSAGRRPGRRGRSSPSSRAPRRETFCVQPVAAWTARTAGRRTRMRSTANATRATVLMTAIANGRIGAFMRVRRRPGLRCFVLGPGISATRA
jgi:hypothetical protein